MGVHPVDYGIFCVLTVSSLALGLYHSTRGRKKGGITADTNNDSVPEAQQEEVFLGGRSLPTWSLALSMLASGATGVGVVSMSAHQYAYGLHFLWDNVALAMTTPCIVFFVLPVLYRLKVTSVFEYIRMRFGSTVGISACIIYFFFSETLGAVSIYSAAVGVSTMLGFPLVACNVMIGVLGTIYTALGGLRGVVWGDCVQGIVLFAAPFVIIAKTLYDSAHLDIPLRPLSDFNCWEHLLRLEVDFSNDETVWAHAIGTVPFHLVRDGLDQMVAQRFLAASTFGSARRVVWAGASMVIFFITTISMTGLTLTYWYRDCDPMLVGSITRYDQVVPLYVAQNLASVAGLRGLFLAGLVGASVSTVSSVINSHAATFYTDIVAPQCKLSARQASRVTHVLEATSGGLMTVFALAVPYMGTATRVLMTLYSGASGPFAGMITVAICLPWANTRGTAAATSLVFAFVLWQTVGRTLSGAEPPRMNTTLLRCSQNATDNALFVDIGRLPTQHACAKNLTCVKHSAYQESIQENSFLLYHLSSYWFSLIAFVATISLSLVFSFILGDMREQEGNLRLCSPIFIRLWTRLGLLTKESEEPIDDDVEKMKAVDAPEEMSSFLQLKELFHSNASQNSKIVLT